MSREMTLASAIAHAMSASKSSEANGNAEWFSRHEQALLRMVEKLPSGSGFDAGTKLDESSKTDRLVFTTDFHHMHESGMYDGWTQHSVIATPSFISLNVRVTGKDRNGIKEYIGETFHHVLRESVNLDSFYADKV